jgi:hypothetical protein
MQDFDTLANSTVSPNQHTTLPAEWVFAEIGANGNSTYAAGTGSSNSGNTYSFGSALATDRAFGGLRSGNLNPTIGTSFQNNTGGLITSLDVAYTGEQWRLGFANRVDRMDFQYSLDATSLVTGSWTDIDLLDFTAPIKTGVGPLNGNAAANRTAIASTIPLTISNGDIFWIRWNDFNSTEADDGLAVDDFSLTPETEVVTGAVPEVSTILVWATLCSSALMGCRQCRQVI